MPIYAIIIANAKAWVQSSSSSFPNVRLRIMKRPMDRRMARPVKVHDTACRHPKVHKHVFPVYRHADSLTKNSLVVRAFSEEEVSEGAMTVLSSLSEAKKKGS